VRDPDLRFNLLTAAALSVVIIVAPAAGHTADEASGLYFGAGVGRSDVDTSCGVTGAVTTSWESAANGRNSIRSGMPPRAKTTFKCGPSD
jgi:hypothetical protein